MIIKILTRGTEKKNFKYFREGRSEGMRKANAKVAEVVQVDLFD